MKYRTEVSNGSVCSPFSMLLKQSTKRILEQMSGLRQGDRELPASFGEPPQSSPPIRAYASLDIPCPCTPALETWTHHTNFNLTSSNAPVGDRPSNSKNSSKLNSAKHAPTTTSTSDSSPSTSRRRRRIPNAMSCRLPC